MSTLENVGLDGETYVMRLHMGNDDEAGKRGKARALVAKQRVSFGKD